MWEIFESLLERDGVTIADVSRATGIKQPVFSNWKRRNSKLSAKNAELIADFFGVTVGYLMGVQEDAQAKSYFEDVKSAEIAQQMFDDPQLRALHHIKKNIDHERFKAYFDMIASIYRSEHPEDSYDFYDREFTYRSGDGDHKRDTD